MYVHVYCKDMIILVRGLSRVSPTEHPALKRDRQNETLGDSIPPQRYHPAVGNGSDRHGFEWEVDPHVSPALDTTH